MATFEDKVIIDMLNDVLKRKKQREALTEADPVFHKARVICYFQHSLQNEVERLLTKH